MRVLSVLLTLAGAPLATGCSGSDGGGTGPDGGTLTVSVTGLPAGTDAAVTLAGPNGFSRSVTASTTLTGLAPGTYTATVEAAEDATARFTAASPTAQTAVTDGATSTMTIPYTRSTGLLLVTITGLPAGVPAAVTVSRGGGFNQVLTATTGISKLNVGLYQVVADTVVNGPDRWVPSPLATAANVTAVDVPATATITYGPATAALTVTVTGLPPSVPASITLTGPGGYSAQVTASTTFSGLVPGTYVVTAANAGSGGDVFTPTPPLQNVPIGSGQLGNAAVAYTSAAGTSFNLDVPQAYLTQAIQRPDGTVGLVAGRDALLRVFVRANESNTVQPDVRVTLQNNGIVVSSFNLEAPGATTPTTINEGTLGSSWNYTVGGALIQPGLTLRVQVDPDNAILELAEGDNDYPASGAPQPISVTSTPAFEVVLVPITTGDGRTGDATLGNAGTYVDLAARLHPFRQVTTAVRIPYATARIPTAGGANWEEILSELRVVKLAEADPRYWYGSMNVPYSSGVAGIGYVAGSPLSSGARTALGWDKPSSRDDVSAHEWGHNFGRQHAPCGGVAYPDPDWPAGGAYSGGRIGVYGYDQALQAVRSPTTYTDIMGYCGSQWTSDYTWEAIRNFRGSAASIQSGPVQPGLLVWGRIVDGAVTLEPAFELSTRPSGAGGSWTMEATDADGAVIALHAFEPVTVADLPGDVRHFTMFIPLANAARARLFELRVSGPGGAAVRRRVGPPPGAVVRAQPVVERRGSGARVQWDGERHPAVMVRDVATGQVLAIGTAGEVSLPTVAGEVELILSDGVRSERVRRRPE